MSFLRNLLNKIVEFIEMLTDWFLILIGVFLIGLALLRIDLAEARYVLLTLGVFFSGFGFWYRRRRLQRRRR